MDHASWKAFIKLSLVSIPIQAYAAVSGGQRRISFHQLHQGHARIQYRKVCPIHGEVPNDEIVKGYEYAKGEYVIVDPDELERIQMGGDRSISIHAFAQAEDIDPLYYTGVSHYLMPDGAAGQKPYALLQAAMSKDGLYALGDVVLGGRQQLVVLRAVQHVLTISGIAYRSEVRDPSDFFRHSDEGHFSTQELSLTQALIAATTVKHLDLGQYHDQYEEKLRALIEAKIAGKDIAVAPSEEPRAVVNLMDALRESLAQVQHVKPASQAKKPARGKRNAGRKPAGAIPQPSVARRKVKPR